MKILYKCELALISNYITLLSKFHSNDKFVHEFFFFYYFFLDDTFMEPGGLFEDAPVTDVNMEPEEPVTETQKTEGIKIFLLQYCL